MAVNKCRTADLAHDELVDLLSATTHLDILVRTPALRGREAIPSSFDNSAVGVAPNDSAVGVAPKETSELPKVGVACTSGGLEEASIPGASKDGEADESQPTTCPPGGEEVPLESTPGELEGGHESGNAVAQAGAEAVGRSPQPLSPPPTKVYTENTDDVPPLSVGAPELQVAADVGVTGR